MEQYSLVVSGNHLREQDSLTILLQYSAHQAFYIAPILLSRPFTMLLFVLLFAPNPATVCQRWASPTFASQTRLRREFFLYEKEPKRGASRLFFLFSTVLLKKNQNNAFGGYAFGMTLASLANYSLRECSVRFAHCASASPRCYSFVRTELKLLGEASPRCAKSSFFALCARFCNVLCGVKEASAFLTELRS